MIASSCSFTRLIPNEKLFLVQRMSERFSKFCVARFSSTSTSDLVTVDTTKHEHIAIVTMQHAPVNSLSLEMCQALSQAIKSAESDSSVQALILRSSRPNIFSAGLDIPEMCRPDLDRLRLFWTAFQQLYIDLYGSRLACVAAVQGHAVAAGCMLALSSDYRVMAADNNDNAKSALTIGLNESKLGIVAPPWLGQQYIDTIGRRRAEKALTLGTLFSAKEALEIELVDELVDSDKVEERAIQVASQWAKIPSFARVASKMLIRQQRIDDMTARRSDDLDHFVNFVTKPATQQKIIGYLDTLAKRKGK